VVKKSQSN